MRSPTLSGLGSAVDGLADMANVLRSAGRGEGRGRGGAGEAGDVDCVAKDSVVSWLLSGADPLEQAEASCCSMLFALDRNLFAACTMCS